jgi:hypothetical protein
MLVTIHATIGQVFDPEHRTIGDTYHMPTQPILTQLIRVRLHRNKTINHDTWSFSARLGQSVCHEFRSYDLVHVWILLTDELVRRFSVHDQIRAIGLFQTIPDDTLQSFLPASCRNSNSLQQWMDGKCDSITTDRWLIANNVVSLFAPQKAKAIPDRPMQLQLPHSHKSQSLIIALSATRIGRSILEAKQLQQEQPQAQPRLWQAFGSRRSLGLGNAATASTAARILSSCRDWEMTLTVLECICTHVSSTSLGVFSMPKLLLLLLALNPSGKAANLCHLVIQSDHDIVSRLVQEFATAAIYPQSTSCVRTQHLRTSKASSLTRESVLTSLCDGRLNFCHVIGTGAQGKRNSSTITEMLHQGTESASCVWLLLGSGRMKAAAAVSQFACTQSAHISLDLGSNLLASSSTTATAVPLSIQQDSDMADFVLDNAMESDLESEPHSSSISSGFSMSELGKFCSLAQQITVTLTTEAQALLKSVYLHCRRTCNAHSDAQGNQHNVVYPSHALHVMTVLTLSHARLHMRGMLYRQDAILIISPSELA